ncbi:MAG TPA: metallophosphoesterase [Bacteroidia bacterium]|nr:metallophosphoesterase [Bacteroidia bacterium]
MKKKFSAFYLLLIPATCFLLQNSACSNPASRTGETETDSLKNKNRTFLFLSDIHLNTFDTVTEYGEDTGLQLWKNFLAKTDSVLASPVSPDFIVYTGDLPAHYSCESGCYLPPDQRATHNANIKAILDGLRSLADKYNKPLFYLPGNNDGLAGDYYSFADEKQQTPFSLVAEDENPFPALNILPGDTAPCMIANPHPTMGYYSASPVKGLRLIALNTVIFSENFVAVDSTTPDSDRTEEMMWLAQQLKEASNKGEKVYIAMHIPPGLDAYSGKSMWVDSSFTNGTLLYNFLAMTNQYQETIAGILYGHTHMDEVRRLYDPTGTKITEVAISCPGVTPQHSNNPGFKIVEYNAESMELLDFTTLYTTPQSEYWGNASYTFGSAYGCNDTCNIFQTLSMLSLAKVSAAMSTTFMVKNGMAGYNITQGIEVKPEQ